MDRQGTKKRIEEIKRRFDIRTRLGNLDYAKRKGKKEISRKKRKKKREPKKTV